MDAKQENAGRTAARRALIALLLLAAGTAALFMLTVIINPAMMIAWILGLWLAWDGFRFMAGWLHVKLAAVIALSGLHGYLSRAVRDFAEDRNEKAARHWRMINEVPTVLLVIIVIMVIVKPF